MENKLIDWSQVGQIFSKLLQNLPTTLYISLASLILGLLLGLLLTLMLASQRKVVAFIGKRLVDLLRSTPLLLLLFLIFFGTKLLLISSNISPNLFSSSVLAILAIGLGMSAYFAEMMYSSYQAVDKGQLEAIQSLAIPRYIGFIRIILPQATIIAIPNLGNLMINIVKLTSLVSLIGIVDIFGRAQKISNNNYGINQLEAFIAVILIYWIINVAIDLSMRLLQKRYQYLIK